jgi:hypothetical protein
MRRAVLNRIEEACPTCPFELRARYETSRHYLRCVTDVLRTLRASRLISPRERGFLRRAARRADLSGPR